MKRHFIGGLMLAGLLAAPAAAQMPEGYLDVFVAKVKMGKRAEFDTINRKMADINRKNKGDNWVAYEVLYGVGNTVYFVSPRANYMGAEDGIKAFEGSIAGSIGKAGMQAMFTAFDATVERQQTEFRKRRWDLSANAPANAGAYLQLVGSSRFLRVATVRVRPGKTLEYEAQLKKVKTAQERANPGTVITVSQSIAGQELGVYYISTLLKSLGDLDKIKTLQEVLGAGYDPYLRSLAEIATSTEVMVMRILPELSNPPEEVVAADQKFWRPAPVAVSVAKPAEKK
jgi:hypothetical protein